MTVAADMFVKINTVFAEGINDAHTTTRARFLSEAGAGIMNIMPVAALNSRDRFLSP